MATSNWLRFLWQRFSVRKTRPKRKATLERKLFLEPLEDRTLLSPVLTVTNLTINGSNGATVSNGGTWFDDPGATLSLTASAGNVTRNTDGTWSWSFATPTGAAVSQAVTITGDDGNGYKAFATFYLNPSLRTVRNTSDSGADSLRQAITDTNNDMAGVDQIDFNIPWNDPEHFYYKDDGIACQVTAADIAPVPTIAIDGFAPITTDAQLADPSMVGIGNTIDPDQAHSWWSITPQSALPMINNSVIIDGTTQPGWAANTSDTLYNANLPIVLDGSNAGASEGLVIAGGNSTVEGLQIQNFANGGIHLLTYGKDSILGNNIPDAGGGYGSPNNIFFGGGGVFIDSVAGNTIGGTTLDARNKFWNDFVSVNIAGAGASNNQVLGNVIGTDGTTEQTGGSYEGVFIDGASDNTIGGTAPGSKNVITSGPGGGDCIEIFGTFYGAGNPSSGNVIQGNHIDTDSTGLNPFRGSLYAIGLDGSDVSNTLIGGPTASARNVIGGASAYAGFGAIGIGATFGVAQTSGTRIEGNYIGVDATGLNALAGQEEEYEITGSGGTIINNTSIVGNIISGWVTAILDPGSGAIIQGNWIGTDSTGLQPVPNGTGIYAPQDDVQICRMMSGQGNIIAYNTYVGILAGTGDKIEGNAIYGNGVGIGVTGTRNRIEGNAIYGNAFLGIDLGGSGVPVLNDSQGHVGPNNFQDFPELTKAVVSGSNATLTGTLNTSAGTAPFTVDVYASPAADPLVLRPRAILPGCRQHPVGEQRLQRHILNGEPARRASSSPVVHQHHGHRLQRQHLGVQQGPEHPRRQCHRSVRRRARPAAHDYAVGQRFRRRPTRRLHLQHRLGRRHDADGYRIERREGRSHLHGHPGHPYHFGNGHGFGRRHQLPGLGCRKRANGADGRKHAGRRRADGQRHHHTDPGRHHRRYQRERERRHELQRRDDVQADRSHFGLRSIRQRYYSAA